MLGLMIYVGYVKKIGGEIKGEGKKNEDKDE